MKQKTLFLFLSLILFSSITVLHAQERLTLEEAVRIALANNYDIKLTSNDLEITKNNVSKANAGMFPVVAASLTNNNSIQNSNQTTASGQVTERRGAKNSNINAGASLSWRVFDGFEMFVRYDQLKELQKLGENNLRLTVLSTVSDVINTYYDLVQQKKQLSASDTAIKISRLRLQTAQNRFEIGKAAKLEVLAANVDLNTDTTNILRQRAAYRTTQIQLNQLLARDVNTQFTVTDDVIIDNSLTLSSLINLSGQQNPALQSAIINQRIADLNLKQIKANRYPDLTLNTGYSLTSSHSALGFATKTTGKGLTYGFTASVNVFNGYLQKKNEKNASIEIDNAKLDYERINQNVISQLSSVYQTYLTNLELVKLEESNTRIAKQNLDITLEKFRLGSIAPIEFREAQRNYVEAILRYTNAQYLAKLAEISLKQIAGTLNLQ
ncbi:MAG TPA: transporter [Sphingobacteriaceae bacterium]|nr:transporter [Sphingobacteriaceae bacterium]